MNQASNYRFSKSKAWLSLSIVLIFLYENISEVVRGY
jgi:hypothetical protein